MNFNPFSKLFKSEKVKDDESLASVDQIKQLEASIGYKFKNKELLIQALKHRSILNFTKEERISSNERLEFLGDAVVNLAVTHFLYEQFPQTEEGKLSKQKAILVSREVLADVAQDLQLGEFVLLTKGEEKTGGRKRTSILSNVFEAIVGAIYLDADYGQAEQFIRRALLKDFDSFISHEAYINYKSKLLEFTQKNHLGLPEYIIEKEEGPDHKKTFYVAVKIDSRKMGRGIGRSKKQAEQRAAKEALERIQSKQNP
ncbi:MAG: ribonuclease III [Calditrichia bacterium]